MRPSRLLPVVVLCSVVASCMIVQRKEVYEVAPRPQVVEAALRVFLADGSVVVFPDGAEIDGQRVAGAGSRYDLSRAPLGAQRQVSLDSVIGMEAFDHQNDPGLTLLASVGLTAVTIGASVALACAADPKCFGSCPTVYSYDDEGEHLEAETFSFSITPLLESRDVDLLGVASDRDGVVSIEVRNEALETHFINHLELLEVRHGAGERVLTDATNSPVLVGPLNGVEKVTDRDGRDVTESVQARDHLVHASATSRVAAVRADDDRDWIELTLPPTDADSVALVLRLRNSLLSTILFYEFMLGRQGAGALDWMASEVEQIGNAVELGSWFYRTMGLRLEVERNGRFEEVARLSDSGPIAWKEVALLVPVDADVSTRVRLSSLADEWRIDHIQWSPRVERPPVRVHPAVALVPVIGGRGEDELPRILEPDDEYLVTSAGTAFTVRFDTGTIPADVERTFLLSSQGYYSEWIRPSWIRSAERPEPFRPTPDLLPELMERWLEVKGPMEASFHETKIPVR